MATALPRSRQINMSNLAILAQDIDLTGDLTVGDDLTVTGDLAVTAAITGTGGLKLAPVAIADAATYAVLAANSGKLHVVVDQGQDITVTLPAAADGLVFEFMYGGAAADTNSHIIVPTAGAFIGGVVFHDQDGDVSSGVFSNGTSNDVFTIVDPDNYWVKFVSDGTDWYLNGYVHAATVCTLADT